MSHVVAIVILLLKIWKTRSVAGMHVGVVVLWVCSSLVLCRVTLSQAYLARVKYYMHAPHAVQVMWAFSIFLEAGAILPQLFMVSKVRARPPSPHPDPHVLLTPLYTLSLHVHMTLTHTCC